MAMGGDVTTNFSTLARSGHYIEYAMYPPSYATIIEVNEPAEIFQPGSEQLRLPGARISLDNLNGGPGGNQFHQTWSQYLEMIAIIRIRVFSPALR